MMISVILPVYNAEKYLRECINSILKQSYSNFELLLINDGSKDSSKSICNEYAAKDERVRVFHQENAGVSVARNKGLNEAKGEYICFVDSDDWTDQNMFETLVNTIESDETDMSYCGYYEFDDKFKTKKDFLPTDGYKYGYEVINEVISSSSSTSIPIWTCIINREIIVNNNIIFTVGCKYGEDQEFIIKCLLHSKSISTVNKCLYYYRVGIDSVMATKKLSQFDYPIAMVRTKKYLIKNDKLGKINIGKFRNYKITTSLILVLNILSNSNVKIKEILSTIKQSGLIKYVYKDNRNKELKWKGDFIWDLNPYIYISIKRFYWKIKTLR